MAGEKPKTTKSGTPSTKRTTQTVKNPYKKPNDVKKKNTSTKTAAVKKDGTAKKTVKKTTSSPKPKTVKIDPVIERDVEQILRSGEKKRKIKSVLMTVLTSFFAVLAAVVVIYFVISLCDPLVYSEFYSSSEQTVKIPGTNEGFVPQGLAYSQDADLYLICGYMQDKSNSRIYLVTPEGQSKEIRMNKENGEKYNGHAGGISCYGNNVYMSNDGQILYVSLTTLLEADDLNTVNFEGSFDVPCSASFTFCDDEMLYVGEFYYTGYDTDDSHIIKLDDGGVNQALVFGYPLDENSKYGVKDIDKPEIAYSVRDKVQGFAVTEDGKIALSCSFSVYDSYLYIYNRPQKVSTFKVGDNTVPLYVLDDSSLEKRVTMPFMSEDLDVMADGDLVISFESYAPKYGGGLLPFSINHIMKYSLD